MRYPGVENGLALVMLVLTGIGNPLAPLASGFQAHSLRKFSDWESGFVLKRN